MEMGCEAFQVEVPCFKMFIYTCITIQDLSYSYDNIIRFARIRL